MNQRDHGDEDDAPKPEVTPVGNDNVVDLFGNTVSPLATVDSVLELAAAKKLDHAIVLGIYDGGEFFFEADCALTAAGMTWLHFSLGMALANLLTYREGEKPK